MQQTSPAAPSPWPVLVASAVIKRRGILIYWATCDWQKLSRSQNAFEETFLLILRDIIPRDVDATLLFDGGFRRVLLVRHLKKLDFQFVIRICSDTHVFTGLGDRIPTIPITDSEPNRRRFQYWSGSFPGPGYAFFPDRRAASYLFPAGRK